tara:strand:- start:1169 stop:1987 length:819 start_codon:yes stop_codon:yes gene_type:complete
MSVPGFGTADHLQPRIQTMMSLLNKQSTAPATTNLFAIEFATPPVFRDYATDNDFQSLEKGRTANMLNYYASAINLPSKQLTTGQITTIGVPYKYATGQAFSQINITFVIPKTQLTKTIFERWVSSITGDGDQYIEYYEDYVCDTLRIYKFEKGSGQSAKNSDVPMDKSILKKVSVGDTKQKRESYRNTLRLPELMSVTELRNVFPTNIGSAQLNNMEPRLLTFTVSFSYERYKHYPRASVDTNKSRKVTTDGPQVPTGSLRSFNDYDFGVF